MGYFLSVYVACHEIHQSASCSIAPRTNLCQYYQCSQARACQQTILVENAEVYLESQGDCEICLCHVLYVRFEPYSVSLSMICK